MLRIATLGYEARKNREPHVNTLGCFPVEELFHSQNIQGLPCERFLRALPEGRIRAPNLRYLSWRIFKLFMQKSKIFLEI